MQRLAITGSIFVLLALSVAVYQSVWRESCPRHGCLDRATLITNYINGIKLSTGKLAVPKKNNGTAIKPASAEERALAWIIHNDPLQLWPNETVVQRFRLQQRYALLTLLWHFLEYEHVVSNHDNDECKWTRVFTCVNSTVSGVTVKAVTKIYSYGGVGGYSKAVPVPGTTLSPDLGLLSKLEHFTATYNNLKGSLPSSLGMKWTNLQRFIVTHNALTGSLPSTLGTTWTNLVDFRAASNILAGSLPPSLGTTWTKLRYFDVGNNSLTGSLSSMLGSSWKYIPSFRVGSNEFAGSLPSSFGASWANLRQFEVHNNSLTGSLPSSLGVSWTKLRYFLMSHNALTGTMPNSAVHWKQLDFATLDNKSLVGFMPFRFCNITVSLRWMEWRDVDCDKVACICCNGCCRNDSLDCTSANWF